MTHPTVLSSLKGVKNSRRMGTFVATGATSIATFPLLARLAE
jgi:hypothetical protein